MFIQTNIHTYIHTIYIYKLPAAIRSFIEGLTDTDPENEKLCTLKTVPMINKEKRCIILQLLI
jgi:hypothetical protein